MKLNEFSQRLNDYFLIRCNSFLDIQDLYLRVAVSIHFKQNDIELIELNEAFAAQSLAVIRELDLNPEIINVNGGAIALGHPLGCTGAKVSVQLYDEMKRRGKNRGLASLCVGGGQGGAVILEVN
jgi:acetyl-CoA acetyltransferase